MCRHCMAVSRRGFGGLAASLLLATARGAQAEPEGKLIEPKLRLPVSGEGPRVALTLDACPGGFDTRIAFALADLGVPATVFVTGIWIAQNPKGIAFLIAHPDLFAIENHGARHIPPILGREPIFGIAPAGDLATIRTEVEGGAASVARSSGRRPTWYRAAAGFYSPDAIAPIVAMGFRIGGYSVNGDIGASLPPPAVAARIAAAKDGDVIVSHVNQPRRQSGEGVVEGVRRLRAQGMGFVHLPETA